MRRPFFVYRLSWMLLGWRVVSRDSRSIGTCYWGGSFQSLIRKGYIIFDIKCYIFIW